MGDCLSGCLALLAGVVLFVLATALAAFGLDWLEGLGAVFRCASYPAC